MSRVYTTEELIEILADERRACLTGQRLNLAAQVSGNPVIDQFLSTEGFQKFAAYQDFRASVHRYQREHKVSGLVWRYLTLKDKTLHYPVVDDQLIALTSDIEILKANRDKILTFWHEVTDGLDLYLSMNNCKDYRAIAPDDVSRIAVRTEWANLCKWEKSEFLEIVLQLGWGKPEDAAYKRGWPTSGSEYVHAVNPGKRVVGYLPSSH